MKDDPIKLTGDPDRIFVSVDERTGKSTLSFAPAGIGAPIVRDDDARGELALVAAREIAAAYPRCVVAGPHFHTSRPAGSPRPRRWR